MSGNSAERRPADPLAGVPARLWRMVALARHRLLMLDYDGTLASFRAERDRARPSRRALDFLKRLAAQSSGTTLAIISGRPLIELERFLGSLPVTMLGEHGWEQRLPDGATTIRAPSIRQTDLLKRAEQLARDAGLAARIERKRTGVVLHTRGLAATTAATIHDDVVSLWAPLATGGRARLDRIHGGVELRLPGRNKGTAVLSLLTQQPPGTLAVYLGDDATDEDAFEAVGDHGCGVRVGVPSRASLAAAWLPSCRAVTTFLEEWLRVTGAPGDRAPSGRPRV